MCMYDFYEHDKTHTHKIESTNVIEYRINKKQNVISLYNSVWFFFFGIGYHDISRQNNILTIYFNLNIF